MFLGALVDAGVPFEVLQDAVGSLNLGAKLELRRVDRSGIDAAKVDVLTSEGEIVEVAHAVGAGGHDHSHSHDHEHSHSHDHDHARDHDHSQEHSHGAGEPHVHGRSLSKIEEIIGESTLADGVKAIALKAFRLLGHAEAKIHNVPVETIHFHEVGAVDASPLDAIGLR
jgi:uncharacterized protein (DUF111 family)